ncbi:hypothetical protein QZM89_05705 [Burkholderia gladioli]|uniref:hypothetical protein n=1 Tax=Burkholderia gladioli TaxID=28095 RepID=UPI001641138A|nr:hypothetical protein [Burkholderia gladioli]MDN7494671.1 hypothetical protein [Burkholderia gladioli]
MTPEEQRAEEQAALERERRAFERRQKAFISVTRQFLPHGSGNPSADDLNELDAADAEWRAADAEMQRIGEEIRTGKRR